MHPSMFRERGFTLIEVTVSIFAFGIITIGLIALVSGIIRGSSQQAGAAADVDAARRVAFGIVNELRRAEYSSTGAYPIESAQAQQLTFYANTDGGSDVERIRYYVSGSKLYRGFLKASGNPPAYVPANETSALALEPLANGAQPLFYYYADTYNGVADSYLAQPVDVTDPRFIRLSLQVYQKGGLSTQTKFTVVSSATVRNLKSNLGQ